MKMKEPIVFFAAATLTTVTTAGCSGGQKETVADAAEDSEAVTTAEQTTGAKTEVLETTAETAEAAAEADEGNYDTGDASRGNVRDQDGIGESELLVVSFGTSCSDSRRLIISTIGDAVEKAFPDFVIRRGFTSQIIIDYVKSRDNIAIDSIGEAPDHAEKSGVRSLVIQPAHLMSRLEYTDLANRAAKYSDAFDKVATGKPLLTTEDDFRAVMKTVTEATIQYDDGETAICFMGRGIKAEPNQVCARMQDMLTEVGYKNYYVGTVEVAPSLDDILVAVGEGSYKKVVLEPPTVVASDHADNDMAGDEEGSWKTAFEDADYEVICLVSGLSQLEAIQQLFIERTQAAVDSLTK